MAAYGVAEITMVTGTVDATADMTATSTLSSTQQAMLAGAHSVQLRITVAGKTGSPSSKILGIQRYAGSAWRDWDSTSVTLTGTANTVSGVGAWAATAEKVRLKAPTSALSSSATMTGVSIILEIGCREENLIRHTSSRR